MASYTRGVGIVWRDRTGALITYANRPTNSKQPSAYISTSASGSAVVTANSDTAQSGTYAVLTSYNISSSTAVRYWTAVENNVWEFKGWKATASSTTSYTSTANPYSYSGSSNVNRYAYFQFVAYNTFHKPTSGSIQYKFTGGSWTTINFGSSDTYVVEDPNGYQNMYVRWVQDSADYTFSCITYTAGSTINRITNNNGTTGITDYQYDIYVELTQTGHTITLSGDSYTQIIPAGPIMITSAGYQVFDIFASDGYVIDKIYVDGSDTGLGSGESDYELNYYFSFADHTVSVTTKAQPTANLTVNMGNWTKYRVTFSGRADDYTSAQTIAVPQGVEVTIRWWLSSYTNLNGVTTESVSTKYDEITFTMPTTATTKSPGTLTFTLRIHKGNWNYYGTYSAHSYSASYTDVTVNYGSSYDVYWSMNSGSNRTRGTDYGIVSRTDPNYSGTTTDSVSMNSYEDKHVWPSVQMWYVLTLYKGNWTYYGQYSNAPYTSAYTTVNVIAGNSYDFCWYRVQNDTSYNYCDLGSTSLYGGNGVDSITPSSDVTYYPAVADNCIITATVNNSSLGSISPSGTIEVVYNANQSFSGTANSGARLSHFVVDGTIKSDGSSITDT